MLDKLTSMYVEHSTHSLMCFINEIGCALERHGILTEAERWFWERQCPGSPIWEGHLGKPADAEAIWRSAMKADWKFSPLVPPPA
jgi:hypothetical protein